MIESDEFGAGRVAYNRLEVSQTRDRQGRITQVGYDALRRLTSLTDPLSRTTTFGWCNYGGLSTMTDARNKTTYWFNWNARTRKAAICPRVTCADGQ